MKQKTKTDPEKPVAHQKIGGHGQPPVIVDLEKCSYAGQEYSHGATVEMPATGGGKVVKTCNGAQGIWE